MSKLSPDSLFHFTPTLDNLLGILKNTFYPRYCYEEFDLISRASQRYIHFIEDAFPMVCFCDVPLSQLMNHISDYGEYGLGMSKEWGIRKKLNPVIYFNKDSHLAERINTMVDNLSFTYTLESQIYSETYYYMKPYEGTLYRGGTSRDNVRFYDEHEWRYVPLKEVMREHNLETSIQRHIFMNPEMLKEANYKLEINSIKLTFDPNDIKYVIIKDESEINNMVNSLREIKGSIGFDDDTIDRLTSRIITVKQIQTDF